MNSLQRSKPNRSGIPKYVWVIAVFVLLSGFAFFFPKMTRTIVTGIAKPIWLARDGVLSSTNFFGGYFVTKNALLRENADLHDQITALQLKSADYDSVTAENQTLKSMLGRTESTVFTQSTQTTQVDASSTQPQITPVITPTHARTDRILARVLSKPPQSPYDTLVLDAGSADGVTLGRQVFMSDTIVIGYITDVTAHTSLVALYSSSGQKNTAEDTRTGASFEMDGQGGANFSITVPKENDVLWGDNFVYPALSPEIMGTVYYVDSPAGSSFKTAYLRIPQNVFSAQWVFVQKM